MGVSARYQEPSTHSNIQEMGHIHLLVLVCSTVLAVTLAADCKDQHDKYYACTEKNYDESSSILESYDDGRQDLYERKVCNLLENLMKCFDDLEENCRQDQDIRARLSGLVKNAMIVTERDAKWKPDLCKTTKRIDMDIFGDATRQAKKKQDEDEKQKSAADANAADDTAAADASAAVDTAAADANAAVDTAAADASADDDNGEATTPAAPTTTQDPNSGLVSCPTAILTLISALLTLAIRT